MEDSSVERGVNPPLGAFSRPSRSVAVERDWLLLLEPTNQRRVLIRRTQQLCLTERGHYR